MNSIATPQADLLDGLFLTEGGAVQQLRGVRGKVSSATQGSYDALFDPELAGSLSLEERLLVALYASVLTPQPVLAAHYRERLSSTDVPSSALAAVEQDDVASFGPDRLAAVLGFTRTLVLQPVEGDRQAVQNLLHAGLEPIDVVTLGQLIAFLSYQVRLAAGLAALQALGDAS